MKPIIRRNGSPCQLNFILARAFIVAGFLFALVPAVRAVMAPPGGGTNSFPTYTLLDSWSFYDNTNWTSDKGHASVSFTNLDFSNLGSGSSLVVDSANPAWLQYNVFETDGKTNLTVDAGTVMFWFGPSWSGTNQGGTGPGVYGRLLEVGGYTPDSSFGWWSLYVDDVGANLYFSTQTNDLSSNLTTYVSAPIAWTTNYFHHVALTYSATNTALYLDGGLVTNGPPLAVYPGPDALANGFFVGSDSNGVAQAHGSFNTVATYNTPMDAGTIQQIYSQQFPYYLMNPLNKAMFTLISATSSPAFAATSYAAISGAGNLQSVSAGDCTGEATNVWFTNVTAMVVGSGTTQIKFAIAGGSNIWAYDVFATGALQKPVTNSIWVWLGQAYRCTNYTVNITSANAFLILGTPKDADLDGLTDAYESLVSHTDLNSAQTDTNGVPYAWYAENGQVPITSGLATQDPDQDALMNYQEYQYGTKPNVSEGFSVWTTGGYTSIP